MFIYKSQRRFVKDFLIRFTKNLHFPYVFQDRQLYFLFQMGIMKVNLNFSLVFKNRKDGFYEFS